VRIAIVIAALGLVAAVSYPLVNRQIRMGRENAAIEWLLAVGEAQERFRATHGGYAATLQSLVEPCPDDTPGAAGTSSIPSTPRPLGSPGTPGTPGPIGTLSTPGYETALRPAQDAGDGPIDCHGRVSSTNFYVSARPVVMSRDGFRGMAMTSAGRIFVFLDGVPPAEREMGPGGMATPLEISGRVRAVRYVE
jgi:hypothetical protein